MNLLLDTQAFLWFIDGNKSLSATAQTLISSPVHQKTVSIVSAWEVTIKVGKGKLSLTAPVELLFPAHLQKNGFQLLNIEWAHLAALRTLPLHHSDPFDRLLIAQAVAESAAVVGSDPAFDAYGITRLW